VLVALMIWLIPKLWRFIGALIRKATGMRRNAGSVGEPHADV